MNYETLKALHELELRMRLVGAHQIAAEIRELILTSMPNARQS